jgi:DNA-binding XRE family transcriptional regulator
LSFDFTRTLGLLGAAGNLPALFGGSAVLIKAQGVASAGNLGGAGLLANPAVRQAYDAQAPEFELARELIAARTQAGLTQGDVAALMGTTQSVVARIESGRGTPSMRTVQRFASAVGARAVVRMEPLTAA